MIQASLTELNFNEILMYLGYRGQELPPELEAQIRRCMDDVLKFSVPRLVYALVPVSFEEGRVKAGTLALEGNDIAGLLKESEQAVLLAATVGTQVSSYILKMQVKDMGSAMIMDACASAAIENICNNFEEDIRKQAQEKGLFLTDRFSPGYGDLPLSLQKDFCTMLNTSRRIGLTVSDNFLMVPQKSVTAIMGIAKTPQPERKRGCEVCSMFKTCAFRKQGRTCSG